jgi:hypothetical protein
MDTLMESREEKKGRLQPIQTDQASYGDPNGTRTHVSGVRGQRPRPLDDGATEKRKRGSSR